MKTFEIVVPVAVTPIALPSIEDGYEAYLRTSPLIDSVPTDQVKLVTGDVPRMSAICLGAVPAMQSLRPLFVELLVAPPLESVDGMTDICFAAYYTHLMASTPVADVAKVQELVARGGPIREHLLIQADALAHKGLISAETVAAIKGGTGYLDMANDLVTLSIAFRSRWSVVKNKTTVEQSEVEQADQIGRELLAAVGARLQPNGEPTTVNEALDRRARAYTLLVRHYDEVRRAAAFARWHEGDADLLVPSLFTRTRARRPAEDGAPEPVPAAPAPNGPETPDFPPAP